jgi:hypothetical protein
MLDGYGCMRHLPDPGSMRDQVAVDMDIYEVIRGRWVERMNKKLGG